MGRSSEKPLACPPNEKTFQLIHNRPLSCMTTAFWLDEVFENIPPAPFYLNKSCAEDMFVELAPQYLDKRSVEDFLKHILQACLY